MSPAPRFTEQSVKFLRALKRHNTREWFNAHKADYESHVRAPMLAVIERLALDFPRIAPDLVASPRSMYRIYRDTRFSPDKTPYKTHVSAAFSHRTLPKQGSAGLYFHLAADQLWIGGGLYAPQGPQLHRIREHIAANLGRFRSLVEAPALQRMGGITGSRLKRVPRGFPPDHEAADYLRLKQYMVGAQLAPTLALSPRFYSSLVRRFTVLAPFIQFLNTPLASSARFPL
ncbi:MAG: DUF2461 domain-containing protein [Vicinamibacterales bacterium]|nr:DUF2461 domain-containing protein [Vicinamibacterales bacterium]